MKKKIIAAAVVAVMGISTYVGINAQKRDVMSDIQMANVEALVSGEGGDQILVTAPQQKITTDRIPIVQNVRELRIIKGQAQKQDVQTNENMY